MTVEEKLESITKELGGNITHYTTLDHSGRQSQKFVIEYDIKQKDEES